MPHYRTRPRRRRRLAWLPALVVGAVAAIFGWWYWGSRQPPRPVKAAPAGPGQPGLLVASESGSHAATDQPQPTQDHSAALLPHGPNEPAAAGGQSPEEVLEPRAAPAAGEPGPVASRPGQGPAAADRGPTAAGAAPQGAAIAAAWRHHEAGKVIQARHELNGLLRQGAGPAERAQLRRLLARIADETIFSRDRVANDPLTESYAVRPGDVLVSIGKRYRVPAGIIMRINHISDARRIRAGQLIKVPRGPFHATIHKAQFRLDVYLGELYLRSFPVGLGVDYGTPEGVWLVKNRLQNPTYYPPSSAPVRRPIAADDPQNPLGEYWIGLEGVAGAARGREGYGIHGTIEPETVGRNASAGCIRMRNDDVAFLYDLLLPGASKVTVLP